LFIAKLLELTLIFAVFFFFTYGIFYDDDVMLEGRSSGLRVFGAFTMSIAFTVVTLKLALETVYAHSLG